MTDLFLLPFAGGTSLTYSGWRFTSAVTPVALDYKGHGFRMKEPLYSSFEEMAGDIAMQIKMKRKNNEISIFGHSMGGLVAWDAANMLVDGGIEVKNIFISACLPPHLFHEDLYIEMAAEGWLMDFLLKYGRIKPGRTGSKFFQKNLFPAIKNDYRLISIHKHEEIKKRSMNIACFYGMQDGLMPKYGMELWSKYTDGRFLLKGFKGGHFYIEHEGNREEVIAAMEPFMAG